MKKILGVLLVTLALGTSLFATGFSAGFRGSIGGNVGNQDSSKDGLVSGFGGYLNLDLFNGFGLQGEVNVVSSTISLGNTNGQSSVTFEPCEIIDMPVMIWYNHNINNFIVGGGLGLNFSLYSDRSYRANNSSTNLGFAIGGNAKYQFLGGFAIVVGTNAVFDFWPTTTVKEGNKVTYIFGEGGSRKAIYGSIGIEMSLF